MKDKELEQLNKSKDSNDLDDFNFDDFDFDSGFSDDISSSSKKRKPISDFRDSFVSDMKDSIISSENIYNSINKQVHKNFSHAGKIFDTIDDSVNVLSSLKKDISKELSPSITILREITKKAVPYSDRLLPKSLSDKIKEFANKKQENDVTQSIDEIRNNEIKNNLQNLFSNQQEIENEKFKFEQTQKLLDDQYRNKKDYEQLTLLAKIKEILKSDYLFNKIYIKKYLSKSLELKYKTVFYLHDIIKVSTKTAELLDNRLKAIALNTGLPDVLKLRKTEHFKSILSNKIYDSISNKLLNFKKDFLNNLKTNLMSNVISPINDITGMVEPMSGMGGEDMGMSKASLAGSILGSMTGEFGLNQIINKLFGSIGLDTKEAIDKKAQYITKSMPATLNENFNKLAKEGGIKGALGTFLKSALPNTEATYSIENQIIKNPETPVPWDLISKKSLIEVIPGYLSKILKYTKSIFTKREEEEEIYDFGKLSFVKRKEYRKTKENYLFKSVEEKNKILKNVLESIAKGYKSHGGDLEKIKKHERDLLTFSNNLAKKSTKITLDNVIAYISGKSVANEDEIKSLFENISDPEAIYDILITAYYKDKDKKFKSDIFRTEYLNELTNLEELRRSSIKKINELQEYGKSYLFSDLLASEKSDKEIKKYRDTITKDLTRLFKKRYKDKFNYKDVQEKLKKTIDAKVNNFKQSSSISEDLLDKYFLSNTTKSFLDVNNLTSYDKEKTFDEVIKEAKEKTKSSKIYKAIKSKKVKLPNKLANLKEDSLRKLAKIMGMDNADIANIESVKTYLYFRKEEITDDIIKSANEMISDTKSSVNVNLDKIEKKLKNISKEDISKPVLKDTPHISKPGLYVQKAEKELHIPLDNNFVSKINETFNDKISTKDKIQIDKLDQIANLMKINNRLTIADLKAKANVFTNKILKDVSEDPSSPMGKSFKSKIKDFFVSKEDEVTERINRFSPILGGAISLISGLGKGYAKYAGAYYRMLFKGGKALVSGTSNFLFKHLVPGLANKSKEEIKEKIKEKAIEKSNKAKDYIFKKASKYKNKVKSYFTNKKEKEEDSSIKDIAVTAGSALAGSAIAETGILGTLGSVGSTALGVLTGPVGWTILGVAVAAGAGYYLYKKLHKTTSEKFALKEKAKLYGISDKYISIMEELEDETYELFDSKKHITEDRIVYYLGKLGFYKHSGFFSGEATKLGMSNKALDKAKIQFFNTWYSKKFVPIALLIRRLFKNTFAKDISELKDIPLDKVKVFFKKIKSIVSKDLSKYKDLKLDPNVFNTYIKEKNKAKKTGKIFIPTWSSKTEAKNKLKHNLILKGELKVKSSSDLPTNIEDLTNINIQKSKGMDIIFKGKKIDTSVLNDFYTNLSKEGKLLYNMRMLAYGVSTTKAYNIMSTIEKTILDLKEKAEEDNTVRISEEDIKAWAKIFGFDTNDLDQMKFFNTWLKYRVSNVLAVYDNLLNKLNYTFDDQDNIDIDDAKVIYKAFKKAIAPILSKYGNIYPTITSYRANHKKNNVININTYKSKFLKSTTKFNINKLGSLSAQEESGKLGSLAIGYDKTGGTSYGKYQISSKTGAFDDFVTWAYNNGGSVGKEVAKALLDAGDPNSGKYGETAKVWKKLAKEGKIQQLEHDFIKSKYYDKALNNLPEDIYDLVNSSKTLENVLWSTAVQHGSNEAVNIFKKAYKKNINLNDYIKKIYSIRSTKFKSSSPNVQNSVIKRFRREMTLALNTINDLADKTKLPLMAQNNNSVNNSPLESLNKLSVPNTISDVVNNPTIDNNAIPFKESQSNVIVNFDKSDKHLNNIHKVNKSQLDALMNINKTLASNINKSTENLDKEHIKKLNDSILHLANTIEKLKNNNNEITNIHDSSFDYAEIANGDLINVNKELLS